MTDNNFLARGAERILSAASDGVCNGAVLRAEPPLERYAQAARLVR